MKRSKEKEVSREEGRHAERLSILNILKVASELLC